MAPSCLSWSRSTTSPSPPYQATRLAWVGNTFTRLPQRRNVPEDRAQDGMACSLRVTLPLIDHLALRVRDLRRRRTSTSRPSRLSGECRYGARGLGSPSRAVEISGSGKGNPLRSRSCGPSPPPDPELPLTSSTAPLSKPAAAITARRVSARITRRVLRSVRHCPDRNNVEAVFHGDVPGCQPRDARLGQRSGVTP